MPLSSTQNDRSPDTGALYAWLSRDADGVEGIVAAPFGNGFLPLVFADLRRAQAMQPMAHTAAVARGFPAQLVRFDRADVVAEVVP